MCGRTTNAWLSTEPDDPEWDDFLRGAESGQFQQSGLWAQMKATEGWSTSRLVLEQGEKIIGGAQILWRRSRLGRVGYISKGPVMVPESPEVVDFVLDLIVGLVRSRRFLALIAQPPDDSRMLPAGLAKRGFVSDHLMSVISATCSIRLGSERGEWEKGMGRTRKLEVRRAVRRGVTVREGGMDDVPRFFELMSATCRRQQVRPNPASPEALRHLVEVFAGAREARLSFAEIEGQTVACVLDLRFGRRVTSWKKGWNGLHPDRHPNSLLVFESLRWAERAGCERLDFAGMDRSLAESLLNQRPLTEDQKKCRDIFNLEFGAQPRLLPEARIYWRNSAIRFLYSKAIGVPWIASKVGRLAARIR